MRRVAGAGVRTGVAAAATLAGLARAAARGKARTGSPAADPDPGEEGAASSSGEFVRRNRALGIGLAVVVVASGVSWAAASRIRSPAEVAARTAPPAPSLITAPVEKRVLSSDVVVRGTVRYGTPQVVTLPLSGLKRVSILTTAPVKDAELKEGSVAFTVSGRPVLVLQGAQPFYRDLGPGAVGEDVRQLEEALARLGLDPGARDGTYDGATEAAVSAWYKSVGWQAMGPTDEQLQVARAAQADRFAGASDALSARESLAQARADLAIAEQRARVLGNPAAPAPLPPSAAADAAARARAEQQRIAATATTATKQRALDQAMAAQRAAQARLEEARTRQPPPTTAEFAALARAAQDAGRVVELAREELAAAQDAAAAAGAAPEVPSAPAPDMTAALDAATARAEVERAQKAVEFAQQRANLMGARPGTGPSTALGIQVPADEVLFFPYLPLRVDEVKITAGQEVVGPVMTVTNSKVVAEAALSPSDAKLVRNGAQASMRAPDLGIEAAGTVTQIDASPGTHGVDPQRFYVAVTPAEAPMSLVGASVVITITVESTKGEVLAVPVAALSVAGDGSTRVQVKSAGGSTRYVTVDPGLSAKGLVEVTPASGARLSPGYLVVVGGNGSGTSSGTAKVGKE